MGVISFICALGWMCFLVIAVINETYMDSGEIIASLFAFCISISAMLYIFLTEFGIAKRNLKRVLGIISFIVGFGMVCMVCLGLIFKNKDSKIGTDSKLGTEMANTIRSFTIKGNKINVPVGKSDAFLQQFPDAKEFIRFKLDGDTVDIPKGEGDRFRMKFKDAVPLPEYGLAEVAPVVAPAVTQEDILLFIALICAGIPTMIYVILTKFGTTKLNDDEILKRQGMMKKLKKILFIVLCLWCFLHTFLLLRSFPVRYIELYPHIDNREEMIKVAPSEKFYPFTCIDDKYDKNNDSDWNIYNFDLRFYDTSEFFIYVGGIWMIFFLYRYLRGEKQTLYLK